MSKHRWGLTFHSLMHVLCVFLACPVNVSYRIVDRVSRLDCDMHLINFSHTLSVRLLPAGKSCIHKNVIYANTHVIVLLRRNALPGCHDCNDRPATTKKNKIPRNTKLFKRENIRRIEKEDYHSTKGDIVVCYLSCGSFSYFFVIFLFQSVVMPCALSESLQTNAEMI